MLYGCCILSFKIYCLCSTSLFLWCIWCCSFRSFCNYGSVCFGGIWWWLKWSILLIQIKNHHRSRCCCWFRVYHIFIPRCFYDVLDVANYVIFSLQWCLFLGDKTVNIFILFDYGWFSFCYQIRLFKAKFWMCMFLNDKSHL